MQVSLELSGHPKANVQKVILSDTTLVGRSRSCGLQIASAAVSRKHCEIRLNGESVSVIDLGSSNGTFVDAERLPAGEERALRPGCRLNIGGVRFLVRYEPAGTAGEPEPAPSSAVAAGAVAAAVPADAPVLPDEPILPDEPLLVDEPILDDEPILPEEPLVPEAVPAAGRTNEAAASADEPEPFADEAVPAGADEPPSIDESPDDEPILSSEDEPILVEDEDQAFAFLSDDEEPAAASPKRPNDSEVGDFLSQLGRD